MTNLVEGGNSENSPKIRLSFINQNISIHHHFYFYSFFEKYENIFDNSYLCSSIFGKQTLMSISVFHVGETL